MVVTEIFLKALGVSQVEIPWEFFGEKIARSQAEHMKVFRLDPAAELRFTNKVAVSPTFRKDLIGLLDDLPIKNLKVLNLESLKNDKIPRWG